MRPGEPGWDRRFQDYAAELIEWSQIPGAAVALALEGVTIYERGFGHRDALRSLPVTSDTRFGLGSVTKSFPALAIMQLADAGKLATTDPVQRWLPEFRLPRLEDAAFARQITIHHFLTHSSGIPPEPALLHARARSICADPDLPRMHPRPMGAPDDIATFEQVSTYEELMALMARQSWSVLGPPGRVLSYCNEGYVLLSAIVERASGQSFSNYLQEHVLDPLELSRTSLYTSETPPNEPEVVPFAADNRSGKNEVFASPAWWDQGQMYGNGGLKSTTRDLLRYLEVYRTGGAPPGRRILSAAGIARMTAPLQPIATGGFYGYGLQVGEAPGIGNVYGHGGGNKGIATQVLVAPEHGLTAVVLTNLANAPAVLLATGAINAFLGRAPETAWVTYPNYDADPRTFSRYVGSYRGQPGTIARVAERDGGLVVEALGETQKIRPYARGSFVNQTTGEAARFLEDDRGEVWALAVGLRVLPKIETPAPE
jgi:CubicO group peptidase (beta-lactamase class C family)